MKIAKIAPPRLLATAEKFMVVGRTSYNICSTPTVIKNIAEGRLRRTDRGNVGLRPFFILSPQPQRLTMSTSMTLPLARAVRRGVIRRASTAASAASQPVPPRLSPAALKLKGLEDAHGAHNYAPLPVVLALATLWTSTGTGWSQRTATKRGTPRARATASARRARASVHTRIPPRC